MNNKAWMMFLPELNQEKARALLQAMKAVLTAEGALNLTQRDQESLLHFQKNMLQTDVIDCEHLAPTIPDDLASVLNDEQESLFAMRILSIMPMTDPELAVEKVAVAQKISKILNVHFPMLDSLQHAVDGKVAKMRKGILSRTVKTYYNNTYWGFTWLVIKQTLWNAIHPDKALINRVKSYADKPDYYTGHHLYQYYVDNKFPFPGSRGKFGAKELMWHDMHHVLTGFKTDVAGEANLSAFESGCCTKDPMDYCMSGMMQLNCGIKIDLPLCAKGGYDPSIYWHAFAAGCAVNQDIITINAWDFWSLLDEPIDEVRKSLNIALNITSSL